MRHEPESLPHRALIEGLQRHWDLNVTELAYAPLGFGSHHWIATCSDGSRRFVTADHLVNVSTQDGDTVEEHFEGLRAAFETACNLRDGGLEFVLAPHRTTAGEPIARVGCEWSLAVFPLVSGEPLGAGPWDVARGAAEAAALVGRLHRAAPPSIIRRWSRDIPHRTVLEETLDALQTPWRTGPFAEPARRLLASYRPRLLASLTAHDRLADQVVASPEPWVVTHGEPHSANFLRTATGEIMLIDWDTVRLAPRERDLELGEGHAFEAYRETASPPSLRPEARELFRVRWSLQDICVYVHLFRNEHGQSEDEVASWQHLQEELRRLVAK